VDEKKIIEKGGESKAGAKTRVFVERALSRNIGTNKKIK
jgi:hypothetical protein